MEVSRLTLAFASSWGKGFGVKLKQVVVWGIPPFLLLIALLALWNNPVTRAYFDGDYWKAVGKFGESLRLAHARYVDDEKAEYETLVDTALDGMTSALDRHSSYYPPPRYEEFQNDTKLQYFGIGVVIRKVEEGILIARVFPSGPAEVAGVRPGDFVAKVEKTSVTNLTLSQVSDLIKGEEGTTVLVGLRDVVGDAREVEVTRGRIQMSSVDDVRVDSNGTGYLRLEQFTSRTGDELRVALADLEKDGVKRLILDLRDNSGGLLSAAVEVVSEFLEEGKLVVSIKGRNNYPERSYHSKPKGPSRSYPLVILINEGSASASEIVAGALGVSGRARLVGEKTYGKGSVQTVFGLEDESGLRLTTAMYYLPDGSTIHESGIIPHVIVPCDAEMEGKLRIQRFQDAFSDSDAFEKLFGFAPVRDKQFQIGLSLFSGKSLKEIQGQIEAQEALEGNP